MTRVVALVLAILAFLPARAGDVSPVTITKRAPIESLDSSGSVAGVAEAKIGDKFVLISAAAGQLTVQDAKGNRFLVAVGATDYIPPTTAAAPPVLPATPPPASTLSPAPATASVPAMPPPPVIPAPDSAAPAPDPGTPGAGGLPADSAMQTVQIGDRSTAKDMSVWPPGGIAGRPLLIAAHGNGGAGPREIKGWLKLARSHHFTIVCPSFLSSVNSIHLSEDEPYLNDCIKWMKDNLQFDHANVFMVGFSGGGFPTWYLATKHPEFFHGLGLQSGNFAGGYYNLDLHKWYNRPIKLIWGTQDMSDIPGENQNAVAALKAEDCKDYTTEIVPGGHHQEHQDLIVAWMEQNLAPPDTGSP